MNDPDFRYDTSRSWPKGYDSDQFARVLGHRLQICRREAGISRNRAALWIDVDASMLRAIEDGLAPARLVTAYELAGLYDISLTTLVAGLPPAPAPSALFMKGPEPPPHDHRRPPSIVFKDEPHLYR